MASKRLGAHESLGVSSSKKLNIGKKWISGTICDPLRTAILGTLWNEIYFSVNEIWMASLGYDNKMFQKRLVVFRRTNFGFQAIKT